MAKVKEKLNIPKGWREMSLLECLDLSPKIDGVKRSDYLSAGRFPIFDQGQNYISGYSNQDCLKITRVPAILFGDHTRVVKFIRSPFVAGADGTKIFWAKRGVDPAFLYYSVLNQKIPNTGYNRHFKFLKDINVLLPPISEQQRVGEILSAVDEEIEKTEKVITVTENLKRGLMQQLFEKKSRSTKFGHVCDFTTGKLDSNAAIKNGAYPFFTCSKETFRIDRYSFDQEAILLAGNNASGVYSVKHYVGKFDAYQRTYVITIKDSKKMNYQYLKQVLQAKLNLLKKESFGSSTKFLTLKLLQNMTINVPTLQEQRKIGEVLSEVDQKIKLAKKFNHNLNSLKKGLMQDLLSGKKQVVY